MYIIQWESAQDGGIKRGQGVDRKGGDLAEGREDIQIECPCLSAPHRPYGPIYVSLSYRREQRVSSTGRLALFHKAFFKLKSGNTHTYTYTPQTSSSLKSCSPYKIKKLFKCLPSKLAPQSWS